MPPKSRIAAGDSSASGLVHFSDDTLVSLDKALEILLEDSKARCALVIDRTGCILTFAGDFHPIGKEVMGATAAGVVAALNTMVATASSPEVSIRLYGSDVDKIHFYLIADRLILCVLYSRRTTAGVIRSAARTFAQTIRPIIDKDRSYAPRNDGLMRSVQYIESKLDDVFRDIH